MITNQVFYKEKLQKKIKIQTLKNKNHIPSKGHTSKMPFIPYNTTDLIPMSHLISGTMQNESLYIV
jgi:hypothetical protein